MTSLNTGYQHRQRLAVSALLAGSIFWGLLWWPLKALDAAGIHGSMVQVISFGVSAILLLPFLWYTYYQWCDRMGLLLLIALLGGWANASLVIALTEGSVVRVMLLFYLAPVWTILAARVFLGELLTRLRVFALVLALLGLLATLGGPELLSTPLSLIDLLALSSGLTFALNNVAIRIGRGLPDSARSAAIFAGCAIISLGFLGWEADEIPQLANFQIWALLALGLLWILPGTLVTFYGVARLDAGKAAIILLAELVVGVFSAVLIGGEHLDWHEIVGGGLILAAALIEARTESSGVVCGSAT